MIKVLIIEDDPMVAQINTEYIMRIPQFKVLGNARNGKEALKFLKAHKNIDLLILDVYMPEMNGIDFLSEIRKEFNNIDVIFVTAAKERQTIQRGLQLGAVDYLIKPFTFERIRLALEKYQHRYHLFHNMDAIDDMSQDELDLLLDTTPSRVVLPKGIHPLTLKKIRGLIDETSEECLDLQNMKEALSLSLVTLRIYLDFLVEQDVLGKESRHGAVGRPTYLYWKKNH